MPLHYKNILTEALRVFFFGKAVCSYKISNFARNTMFKHINSELCLLSPPSGQTDDIAAAWWTTVFQVKSDEYELIYIILFSSLYENQDVEPTEEKQKIGMRPWRSFW